MSDRPTDEQLRKAHPDFDGHLSKPLKDMSPEQRIEWAWQGMVLLHWARHEVRPTTKR